MDASFVQDSFLGGEWSPVAQGRITLPAYKTAMNICFNGFPIEPGAWTTRSGIQLNGYTLFSRPARLYGFTFEENFPYNIEFTAGNMLFWDGPNRATTNDSVTIVSISTANPAVIQTSTATPWSSNNLVYITGLGTV